MGRGARQGVHGHLTTLCRRDGEGDEAHGYDYCTEYFEQMGTVAMTLPSLEGIPLLIRMERNALKTRGVERALKRQVCTMWVVLTTTLMAWRML